jgi:hypothetical protein
MQLLALFSVILMNSSGAARDPSETPVSPATPGYEDYWARRKAVVVRVEWDDPDSIPDVQLLRSEAPQRAVDSLRTLAMQLRWPNDLSPSVRNGWAETALFVTDRTESAAWPAAQHLPDAVAWALERGHPAAWLQAHAKVDPRFGLDDFVRYETRAIWRNPQADQHPGLLHTPQMQAKLDFGLLAPSPDEHWVLDPFYDTEVYADGKLGRGPDAGFQIYDAGSGALVFHDVGLGVELCVWLDARTFVLMGHEELNPTRDSFGYAAAIRVGDVEAGRITTYRGAPLPPLSRRAFWKEALPSVYRAAYPRVSFDD